MNGGLGDSIDQLTATNMTLSLELMAVNDAVSESIKLEVILGKCHLDAIDTVTAWKPVLNRK